MILRILAVGDVVGAPGLTFLTERLRAFQEQEHIDFTVVNGENANVVGVTPKQADAIFAAGADVARQPHVDALRAAAVSRAEKAHPAPGQLRAAVPGPRLGRIFRARWADLRHQPHGALHARREHG